MPAKAKTAKPRKRGQRKQSAAPKSAAQPLAGALAEAAWSQADLALAEALAECDAIETAASTAQRAAARALLAQALARAARKRGLSFISVLGARERYDANIHELAVEAVKSPRMVHIQARGVARGSEILRRARVSPVTPGRRRKSGQ